jgi:kynurenine formamidase
MTEFKTYQDLLQRKDQPPGSSWGLFDNPQRGMAELAGAAQVLRGVSSVTDGRTFSLDYTLDHFAPGIVGSRQAPHHEITSSHRDQRDDRLDGFWLQGSSHLDGLRHRRHHQYGFYNGFSDAAVADDPDVLGVEHWAAQPIVGRGVVIDVAGYLAEAGRPLSHLDGSLIEPEDLDAALARQEVSFAPGDIALIHTGWGEWWTNEASTEQKREIAQNLRFSGLRNSEQTIAWFWDRQVALVGSDTVALEVLPVVPESTYGGDTDNGLIHQDLIALLGLPIGELWKLGEIVQDSYATGRWDALVVVKPLALRGGVGTPANALAIR